jgi:hypothetical protein
MITKLILPEIETQPTILDTRARQISINGSYFKMEEGGLTSFFDYAPGNGTKYLIQIVMYSDYNLSRKLGYAGSPFVVVTLINNTRHSYTFYTDRELHPHDMFPLTDNRSDQHVLAEFITAILPILKKYAG